MPCLLLLTHLWQFAQCTQATGADVHRFRGPVDLKTTTMYVQHKATTCAVLRKWHIIAIHRLALADITTTCCHDFLLPQFTTDIIYYHLDVGRDQPTPTVVG